MIYDHVGPAKSHDILMVFKYAAKKYGVKHFVIDSLMMMSDINNEKHEETTELILRLKQFAMDYRVHLHLVAHSKKPDSKHDPNKHWPTKYDISGSSNISNLADNVICVWRNKEKEIQLAAAADMARTGVYEAAEQLRSAHAQREDALFVIQKNRETGEEFARRLWFDKGGDGSWQYFDEKQSGMEPRVYWKGI